MNFQEDHIFFTTFTVNHWVSVFSHFPQTTFFILDCFDYLVSSCAVDIYAFCIMRDHLHVIWKHNTVTGNSDVLSSFKKYTSKKIIDHIKVVDPEYIDNFMSERVDRGYKFWKLNSDNFRLQHKDILVQKIKYIHRNPTKGDYKTVDSPEDYLFSSAQAYVNGKSNFSFLTVLDYVPM